VQHVKPLAQKLRHLKAGSIHQDRVQPLAKLSWQYSLDTLQSLIGRNSSCRPAPGPHQPRTQNECRQLIPGKHQRRQVEITPQRVPNPCLALDRHTRRLKITDVAVDRSLRDLELLGQHARRLQPAAA
jgi:hypothetical protein